MDTAGFQVRECVNPGCKLRFPVPGDASSAIRCPVCLGETVHARRGALPIHKLAGSPSASGQLDLEALLDNVRSAENVGSIFRSAEGLGLRRLYLAGITPTPVQARVKKASLGAEAAIEWTHHNNGLDLAQRLQHDGHAIWALETAPGSTPVQRLEAPSSGKRPPVLVIGNEVVGVDPGIADMADRVLCLPMSGRKTSFNAAVAFAIAVYALTAC